jgi:ABC-type amino acid transport substrate-binding protein
VYNNRITVFDMELAIHTGNILGRKIQIVDMSFDSLILSWQAEKIDFAISYFDLS